MNLEQAYRQISEYRNYIKPEVQVFPNKEQPFYYSFKYVILLKTAIERIQQFAPFLIDPSVLEDINKITNQYNDRYSEVTTDKNDGDRFIKAFTSLDTVVNKFLNYIEPDVLEKSDENGLTVKLYHVHTLEDFEKTLSQLKFAIGVPAYDLGGQVELKEVDSGSILLKLLFDAIIGSKILKLIGGLIQSAIDLKTEYHKSEMATEHLRSMRAKNDMLEIIVQQVKDNHELDKLERVQRILKANNIPSDKADTLNTYKGIVETFGDLLEKGVEITPSLIAPKEVKDAFPDAKAIKELKEAQKLLEEAKKNNEPKDVNEADNTNEAGDSSEADDDELTLD
ncbi:hypothetical protein [Spirosoma litoris]